MEVEIALKCPEGHKSVIKFGKKLVCSKCGYEPPILWDGKSHFLGPKSVQS